jgi:putative cell wall-binding protein
MSQRSARATLDRTGGRGRIATAVSLVAALILGGVALSAPASATPVGEATATAVGTDLHVTVGGVNVPVSSSLASVAAPANASSTATTLSAPIGTLGSFTLAQADAVSSAATTSSSEARGEVHLTNAVLQVPGLTGANAVLRAATVVTTAICPTDRGQAVSATAVLPATVTVAGQTVNVVAGGSAVVPISIGLTTGQITVAFRTRTITTDTSAATAFEVTVNVDATGVASTTGTITLASATCLRPPVVAPAATGISPSTGSVSGGSTVTLTGSGLSGTTAVTVGGQAATGVTVVNDTSVTFTTPAHAAGATDVVVTTPNGSATLAASFTYQVAASPPSISGLSPAVGPVAGGTTVTLTGANLTGTTGISVGGQAATDLTVVSATSVTFTTPAHAVGPTDVELTTPAGSATLTAGFTYQIPVITAPTIVAVTSAVGPVAGGTTVTLTGTNLTGTTGISVGGQAASDVTVVSATSVTFTTPAHATGATDVVVTTPAGSATLTAGFTYQAPVVAAPTIVAVTPDSGPVAGGTTVALTGTNLTGTTGISVGGQAATDVTVLDATSVSFTSPAHAGGATDVVVTTPAGSATLTAGFTYQAPVVPAPTIVAVTPDSGPVAGGTTVVLTGTSLTGASAVTVGGLAATAVTVLGATSVTFTTPAHAAGPADVTVTTPAGSVTYAGTFTYLVPPTPTVTAVTPSFGPVGGGTTVALTGTDLTGTSAVTVGGQAVTHLAVLDDTSVTFTTPAHAAGATDVVVTTPAGSTTLAGAYTFETPVVPAPTLTAVSPATGPTTGGTTGTVTGTNLTGTTAIVVGGQPATGLTVLSATSVTFTTPAHAAGPADVSIATAGGSATSAGGFTYVAVSTPAITLVAPATGPVAGGTTVTVTGTNLTGTTGISVGGQAATVVTVVDDHTVTFTSPAHAAGPADVTVTTPVGDSTHVGGFTYETLVAAAPTLVGVSPATGPTAGGTTVTLTGANLTGTSVVTVGGQPATHVTVVDSTTLTFTAPAHAAAAVAIAVTTPGGSVSLTDAFTYVAPVVASPPPPAPARSTGGAGSTGGASPGTVPPVAPVPGTSPAWSVVRVAGEDATSTGVAASRLQFPRAGSAGAVVLARVDVFADALVGGPLAAANNAPILLSRPTGLAPTVSDELARVLARGGRVYLLGGASALDASVAEQVASLGFETVRIAGTDRYDTAVKVAAALGNPSTVFEATGLDFPDAVAAVPAAVHEHAAILLTAGTAQSGATARYLAAHAGSRFGIGHAATIADPRATALAGADRYETAAHVANMFFATPDVVGIASGATFADALTGGPMLGTARRPMLLVPPDGALPAMVTSYLRRASANALLVFGGTNAVQAEMLAQATSTD